MVEPWYNSTGLEADKVKAKQQASNQRKNMTFDPHASKPFESTSTAPVGVGGRVGGREGGREGGRKKERKKGREGGTKRGEKEGREGEREGGRGTEGTEKGGMVGELEWEREVKIQTI